MSFSLTRNFWSNARGVTFQDGSGVTWSFDKSANKISATVSGGTVTSVGLSDGSTTPVYTINGSPVVGSGTLTFTLKTQSANTAFMGPTSGGAAQPTFRALVAADISGLAVTWPNLQTFGGGISVTGGTITLGGFTLALTGNAVLSGTNTGDQAAYNTQTGTSYTLVASDKTIWTDGSGNNAITVPSGVFSQGNVVKIVGWTGTRGTNVTTIVAGTGMSLFWANGTTGSGTRTVTSPGIAWIEFLNSSTALVYGFGIT